MSKIIVAGDPGAKGAIAWRDPQTNEIKTLSWKKIVDGEFSIVKELSQDVDSKVFYVEKVSGYLGKEQPGSRMFNFGEAYGAMWAPFKAFEWKVNHVDPKTWQKALFIQRPARCDYDTGKKILKARATKWFPEIKVTETNADALLILKYAEAREPVREMFPEAK